MVFNEEEIKELRRFWQEKNKNGAENLLIDAFGDRNLIGLSINTARIIEARSFLMNNFNKVATFEEFESQLAKIVQSLQER